MLSSLLTTPSMSAPSPKPLDLEIEIRPSWSEWDEVHQHSFINVHDTANAFPPDNPGKPPPNPNLSPLPEVVQDEPPPPFFLPCSRFPPPLLRGTNNFSNPFDSRGAAPAQCVAQGAKCCGWSNCTPCCGGIMCERNTETCRPCEFRGIVKCCYDKPDLPATCR